MKLSNTYVRKKVEDAVRPSMISATSAFSRESVPSCKLKSRAFESKKVVTVGRKRPTYYTCEKRLTGTTGMHAQSF